MCKSTKTSSPVLSLYLETEYVNEIAARGYALRPNLSLPTPAPGAHSSGGSGGVAGIRETPSS
jgi:hypothetical protein